MNFFALDNLLAQHSDAGRPYFEFLRRESMSVGIYELPAGGVDGQSPHTEDEIYYVLAGRAEATVGEQQQSIEPGSVIFVEANAEHRFHDITEDLRLLVIFAPPESSDNEG